MFAPNGSHVYVNTLLGLRREFIARGVDAHVGWSYLRPEQLPQFCDVFKPDAILEIDRTRNNALNMPKDVISIAWIQDWRSVAEEAVGSSNDRFGGSEHYYFCAKPETLNIDPSGLPHWDYLLIATDPETYFPAEVAMESDFSLIGYIPAKENLDRIDHPLGVQLFGSPTNTKDFGTIRQLVDALRAEGISWNTNDVAEARRVINRHVRSFLGQSEGNSGGLLARLGLRTNPDFGDDRCLVPDDILYFVENEVMRAIARSDVIHDVLKVSTSVRLFGVGMWQTYPEFAPYYKGIAETESDVRDIYRSTRINLHNAMTQMHSRALDCMACGAVIMVNKMRHNDPSEPDCLRAHFEPGAHYFEYDDGNLAEPARALLADADLRHRAGREAAKAVAAHHTWGHRVEQILADLAHA
jgi:hypothetical protein